MELRQTDIIPCSFPHALEVGNSPSRLKSLMLSHVGMQPPMLGLRLGVLNPSEAESVTA